jgi:hypothetical protein
VRLILRTLSIYFSLDLQMDTAARERIWTSPRTGESYSVDAALEDTWLEALNAFQHLYLRSICEGHMDGASWGSRKSMPILRVSVIPSSSTRLQRENHLLEQQIDSLFSASPLSDTTKLQHGWASLVPNDYFIHLDAKRERTSEEMEAWVQEWFREAIVFLQRVDSAVALFMKDPCDAQV